MPNLNAAFWDRIGTKTVAILNKDSCTIVVPTASKDAAGAPTTTFADGATVACQVVDLKREPGFGVQGGRVVPDADFVVYVPRSATVNKGYRIRNARTGETYTVTNDPNEPTHKDRLACQCKELR